MGNIKSLGQPLKFPKEMSEAMSRFEKHLDMAHEEAVLTGLPIGLAVELLEQRVFKYRMTMIGLLK